MTFVALTDTDARLRPFLRFGCNRLAWSIAAVFLAVAIFLSARILDEPFSICAIALGVGAIVAWIVVQDLRTQTIADAAVVSIAVLALADRWSVGDTGLSIMVDCLLTGGVLLAFRELYYRQRGFDGLGLGDVKLAAAGGVLVGAGAFAWALLAASLLGICWVAARGSATGTDRLAFGAILAPMIWLAWVAQQAPVLVPFGAS